MKLTELIARAPWREAVTYRDTWPHGYVLSEKDGQRELLNALYARFQDGDNESTPMVPPGLRRRHGEAGGLSG